MSLTDPMGRLNRDIADAFDYIADLDVPRREAAELLADAVRYEVPVVSGYLQSTVSADDEGVGVSAVYAGVVHDSDPYAERAVDAVDWLEPFGVHVDQALSSNIRSYYT